MRIVRRYVYPYGLPGWRSGHFVQDVVHVALEAEPSTGVAGKTPAKGTGVVEKNDELKCFSDYSLVEIPKKELSNVSVRHLTNERKCFRNE